MIKKALGWILLVGLVGLLTWGAIYRTQAKLSDGRVGAENGPAYGVLRSQGQTDTNEFGFPQANLSRGNPQAENQRGQGSGGQAGQREGLRLNGVVASVDDISLVVSMTDGGTLELANGPWFYAQEMGFNPQIGDQLWLEAFYDAEGHLEIRFIENITSGEILVTRDESGRPMWAGRGRR